jgi:hypothetical protein
MQEIIQHYIAMGYKVSFQPGATHHIEVGLMKRHRLITQQFKDDHMSTEYVRDILEHIHEQFKPKNKN